MNALLFAFYETARRWRLVLLIFASSMVWLAAFFLWLGIPVAAAWQLVLQAIGALALLAAPCLLIRLVYRKAGGGPPQFTPTLLIGLLFAVMCGGILPYRLIWWIPQLQPLAAQFASLAVRFSTAAFLFSFTLVWIVVIVANPNGKDLPSAER